MTNQQKRYEERLREFFHREFRGEVVVSYGWPGGDVAERYIIDDLNFTKDHKPQVLLRTTPEDRSPILMDLSEFLSKFGYPNEKMELEARAQTPPKSTEQPRQPGSCSGGYDSADNELREPIDM